MWNGWMILVILLCILGIILWAIRAMRTFYAVSYIGSVWYGVSESFRELGYWTSVNKRDDTFTIRFMGSAKKGYRQQSRPISAVKFCNLLKRLEKVRKSDARQMIEELIGLKDSPVERQFKAPPEDWKIGNKIDEEDK